MHFTSQEMQIAFLCSLCWGKLLRNTLTHSHILHHRLLNLVGLQLLHYVFHLTCYEYCISITVILYELQRGFLCTIRAQIAKYF